MTAFDRRQFLRLGKRGAALGALGALWSRGVWASVMAPEDWIGGVVPEKKLLYVFLRGGNDGVNTLFPSGDAKYYQLRDDIALAPGTGIDFGSTNCELHPAMSDLQPLLDDQDLACIHRVGFANSSRSHFEAMQIYETAYAPPPGGALEEYGFLARYIQEIATLGNPLPAAGFETLPRRSLLADDRAFPHIPDLAAYALDPALVGHETEPNGSGAGLLGAYVNAPPSEVREAGLSLLRSLGAIAGYDPANQSAAYPANDHGDHCREALYVLGATECNVATISIGSFDTHANQGGATGRQADLLRVLAQCLRGVYEDATGLSSPPFAPFWDDLVVVCASEFGRTVRDNGNMGTDHGTAGVALVAGGPVRGRQYNCDGNKYYVGGQSPLDHDGDNGLKFRTDFRAIYAEVLQDHLGMSPAQLDVIIPGYSALSSLPAFKPLNFILQSIPF